MTSDERDCEIYSTQQECLPDFWREERDACAAQGPLGCAARRLAAMFWQIDGIGNHGPQGYDRFAWSDEEAWLRVWFAAQMQRRGFRVEVDAAGNQWAWLGEPSEGRPGVSIGSHLDSVPGGGAFDGPLGVLSAIAAIDALRDEGWEPPCPLGVANFHDEEGARFAIACFGSRVLTGVLPGRDALRRVDGNGVDVRTALSGFGGRLQAVRQAMAVRDPSDPRVRALSCFDATALDRAVEAASAPQGQAADPAYLARSAAHIELHVEQGCAQRDLNAPVAVADAIWPHGRWRVEFEGEPNHAGSTPIDRRHDPMVAFARFVLRVRQAAATMPDARATVGRVEVEPNGVNVIASHVVCWLDCRARQADVVHSLVQGLEDWLADQDMEGVVARITRESWTAATVFSGDVRELLVESTSGAPVIGTAAGHDAGILAETGHAAGMLFVRNETGASHTPAEYATLADSARGVLTYAKAVRDCAARVSGGWRPAPSRQSLD